MRAKIEAQKILRHFYVEHPNHIELESFCAYFDAHIEYKLLEGSEGRITHNGNTAVISVSSKLTNTQRQRFIVGHELGHFILHNSKRLFLCEGKDFFRWINTDDPEAEANQFSAELLMPENLFLKKTVGRIVSVDLLSEVSDYFNSSFTATAFRYVNIGQHPSAMVFCTNGVIKWANVNQDFPLKFIEKEIPVSPLSYTSDYFKGESLPSTPELIPYEAWFSKDFHGRKNMHIYEQCFPLDAYNSIIALLWMD